MKTRNKCVCIYWTATGGRARANTNPSPDWRGARSALRSNEASAEPRKAGSAVRQGAVCKLQRGVKLCSRKNLPGLVSGIKNFDFFSFIFTIIVVSLF